MIASEQPAIDKSHGNALDWIREEHGRQLTLFDNVESFLEREFYDQAVDEAGHLVAYLTHDAVLHMQDEEEDLFPQMRLRCKAEDEIDTILLQLTWEHNLDRFLIIDSVIDLKNIIAVSAPHQLHVLGQRLLKFTEVQRRHIGWENDIVLPLARKRLRREDLKIMADNMTARRNRANALRNTFDRATPHVDSREWISKARHFFSTS